MSTPSSRPNWRRVIPAAGTLAAFYSVFVCLLLLVMEAWGAGARWALQTLREIAFPLLIAFLISFAALAAARRLGFAALWTLLSGMWIWLLSELRSPLQIPHAFVFWTVLALPLWVIGQCGIASPPFQGLPIGKVRVSFGTLAVAAWTVLVFGSGLYGSPWSDWSYAPRGFPRDPAELAAWLIWAPAPILLAAFAMRHVYRGTTSNALAGPA